MDWQNLLASKQRLPYSTLFMFEVLAYVRTTDPTLKDIQDTFQAPNLTEQDVFNWTDHPENEENIIEQASRRRMRCKKDSIDAELDTYFYVHEFPQDFTGVLSPTKSANLIPKSS